MFNQIMKNIPAVGYSSASMLLVCSLLISPVTSVSAVNAGVGMTDISGKLQIKASGFRLNRQTGRLAQSVTLINTSKQTISGGMHLILDGLNQGLQASSGKAVASLSAGGFPVIQLNAAAGSVLRPNEKINIVINFDKPVEGAIRYRPRVLNDSTP